MQVLPPLPLSLRQLQRYRLEARRKQRPDLLGGHQVRRKGQSLQFREYGHYHPGDDIRHVDWRASSRYGLKDDLLVRTFAAEEQLTLVISIDTRETMFLPETLPKAWIASWLTEAISNIALQGGDRVILHQLFGKAMPISLRGQAARTKARKTLMSMLNEPVDETLNLKYLHSLMPPTAVWIVLSDLYFADASSHQGLARALVQAHDGMRWLMVIDLDSWPLERAQLGLGARRIEGPGMALNDPLFEIDEAGLNQVSEQIAAHKAAFRNLAHARSYDTLHWAWPETLSDGQLWFRQRFLKEPLLARLFMRDR